MLVHGGEHTGYYGNQWRNLSAPSTQVANPTGSSSRLAYEGALIHLNSKVHWQINKGRLNWFSPTLQYIEIYGYSCPISSCGYDYGFILPVEMQVRTMTTSRVDYFCSFYCRSEGKKYLHKFKIESNFKTNYSLLKYWDVFLILISLWSAWE